MKRVSAFTVFNAKKKEREEVVTRRPPVTSKGDDKSLLPIRRAQSSQSMDRNGKQKDPGSAGGSGSRGKRFLNALRSGNNLRESIRLSSKKQRPISLTSMDNGTPHPALDRISLVGLKDSSGERNKARKRLLETAAEDLKMTTTPVTRKSPRGQGKQRDVRGSPLVSKKSAQTSTTSLKLTTNISATSLKRKAQSPKLTKKSNSYLNIENGIDPGQDGTDLGSGKKQKRKQESESPSGEKTKKRRRIEKGERKVLQVRPNTAMELPYMFDSTEEASKLFDCMIHPVKPDRFFSELWEKKPLLVKRHTSDYNKGWFSTAEFDKILRQENIQWGVNLDATSFVNDKRETHNQSGRAHAPVVWDMYQAGCSMRLLNPQTYSRNVWKVLSVLQEYFGCCVGANIYLTPPGTQGFAPHYDDIEAFILQLEGKKHWRLYSPRNDEEVLPRFSSGNFSQSEFGEPILDTVLEAGDLLYFPRGTIHQGNATDEHSLHITVSCYQLNTWGDLLQKLLPTAIDMAMEENAEFRAGLPRNYLNYMGIVHSEKELPERKNFIEKVQSLVTSLVESLPIDSACDQMGKQLMYDSMPPVLSEGEKSCSVLGAGERWDASQNRVLGVSELQPDTVVKLIRRGALRLLTEEDRVRIYYNVENARVYRSAGPNFIEITAEMAPAVEYLINAYPHYTSIESLPLENIADQLSVVSVLYEKGLLITGEPLEPTYDEPGDETDDDL